MEREHDDNLVELGTASVDTHGEPVGWPPERTGYWEIGLIER